MSESDRGRTGKRLVVLVDGQHYPPVVERAIAGLREEGGEVMAAVFLGGTEKTERVPDLGLPVFDAGSPQESLQRALDLEPDEVVDLSDEPVLDHRSRLRLASSALIRGVAYSGAGYRYEPPRFPRLSRLPAVAVTGTGKRTGKTAAAIELARFWRQARRQVVMVTMGRGGPPEPVVLRAGAFESSPEGLLALAEQGFHAASDYVEDAVFAGVDTVGTWRCGAGPAGGTDRHNFAAGVAAAEQLDPSVMIYEGSGTAVPPAAADRHLLVMPAEIDPEFVTGYFGPFRLALADAVLITGGAGAERETARAAVSSIRPNLPVFSGSYRLEASTPVAGRRVLLVTTAPPRAAGELSEQVLHEGASSATVAHTLSDRARLREDLAAAPEPDLVVVEVKAAAIDHVVPWAKERGVEVAFAHNRIEVDDMEALAAAIDPAQATTS